MNTYNKVPEVPFKPLNQTKKASTRRAMIFKDLIPMLIRRFINSIHGRYTAVCLAARLFCHLIIVIKMYDIISGN